MNPLKLIYNFIPNLFGFLLPVGNLTSQFVSGLKFSILILFLIGIFKIFKILEILICRRWAKFILVVKTKDLDKKIDFQVVDFKITYSTNDVSERSSILERKEIDLKAQLFENSYFNYFTNYEKDPISQFKFTMPATRIIFDIPLELFLQDKKLHNVSNFYHSKLKEKFFSTCGKFSQLFFLDLKKELDKLIEKISNSRLAQHSEEMDFINISKEGLEVLMLVEPNILPSSSTRRVEEDSRRRGALNPNYKILLDEKDFSSSSFHGFKAKLQSWPFRFFDLTFYSESFYSHKNFLPPGFRIRPPFYNFSTDHPNPNRIPSYQSASVARA